ncbi:MAG: TIGR00153 family protein, partial [Armatimonadota bacterium]|nr:TIGR00153 family protein [Armatimonadota bacterium]
KGREREVRELILQHLDKVGEVVARTRDVLEDYLAGRLEAAKAGAINVDHLETDADRLRRSVNDLLYRGAFLPIFRSDLHDFVERMDMIADAAETTCDFLLGQRPEIPAELADALRQILTHTQDAYAALHEAVHTFFTTADEATIRDRLTVVGITESTIDDIEWKLTRQIFTSDLSLAAKIHLNQFLETLTEISDQVEDTGDRLEILHIGSKL